MVRPQENPHVDDGWGSWDVGWESWVMGGRGILKQTRVMSHPHTSTHGRHGESYEMNPGFVRVIWNSGCS